MGLCLKTCLITTYGGNVRAHTTVNMFDLSVLGLTHLSMDQSIALPTTRYFSIFEEWS